jgi:hypothetical protein
VQVVDAQGVYGPLVSSNRRTIHRVIINKIWSALGRSEILLRLHPFPADPPSKCFSLGKFRNIVVHVETLCAGLKHYLACVYSIVQIAFINIANNCPRKFLSGRVNKVLLWFQLQHQKIRSLTAMQERTQQLKICIIGAGEYDLSVALHLSKADIFSQAWAV